MKTNPKIPEELIYKIWEEKRLDSTLTTADGLSVEIMDCGVRNNDEAGPDYRHARIKIGNITFTGDVEIDTLHSDWKAHGHNLNQRYNKVILHAVLSNDSSYPFVVTQSGRKVPTLSLDQYLSSSIKETIQLDLKAINSEDEIKMPCAQLNHQVDQKEKLYYIKNLGLLRFRKKCEKNIERLKELILLNELQIKEPKILHDFHKEISERDFNLKDFENLENWQQLYYEQVFEALGYSKNKDIMLKLSRAVDVKFLKSIQNPTVEKIESVLFHISGLFPDVVDIPNEETSEYIRKSLDLWNSVKNNYDSGLLNKNDWNYFKLRPQNFPTIRIAAGARLLERIILQEQFIKFINIFKQHNDVNKLIAKLRNELIIKGDGYWASHYNFNKETKSLLKYFIGLGRADEIVINIILPIYSIYFEIHGNKELSQKVLDLFLNYYQKEGNHLVDQINETLGLKNEKFRSVYYQGMIDLFRNYCIKKKCMECEIGKKVFN
ncbi:MAG TPA: hypothetical protein DHV28_17765 [Ignavibacteriales bacterium]|nr:hypothetical protein [Ignavibacteriales bacterium]